MTARMNLMDRSRAFLAYLEDWHHALTDLPLRDLVANEPDRVAILSVDVINGFCKSGPLASERVGRIVGSIADLFKRADALGVRNFVLTQDTHDPHTPEFQAYPPHAVRGTEESEAVDELKTLPFFDRMVVLEKNSISSDINTGLSHWLAEHPKIDRFVVVGDCTDLCIYQAAMQLRLEANAFQLERRVIVPAEEVDTFDTPVSFAREYGIKAHEGDLHHILFLHHMALNGIEIVKRLS